MSDTPLPQTAEAPASGSFGRLSRLALPGLPQFWRTLQAPNSTLLAAGLIVPNLLSLASLSTLVDIGFPAGLRLTP